MRTYKIIMTMLIAAMSMPLMAQSEGGLLLARSVPSTAYSSRR